MFKVAVVRLSYIRREEEGSSLLLLRRSDLCSPHDQQVYGTFSEEEK